MARGTSSTPTRTGLTPTQYIALLLGAVFTLLGIAGFFATGFDDFVEGQTNETLLGLELNGLHNLAHLGGGVLGLLMWRRYDTAKTYCWIIAATYAVLFVYGLFVADEEDGNLLSLNTADNWFHLAILVVALAGALWPGRDRYAAADRR